QPLRGFGHPGGPPPPAAAPPRGSATTSKRGPGTARLLSPGNAFMTDSPPFWSTRRLHDNVPAPFVLHTPVLPGFKPLHFFGQHRCNALPLALALHDRSGPLGCFGSAFRRVLSKPDERVRQSKGGGHVPGRGGILPALRITDEPERRRICGETVWVLVR